MEQQPDWELSPEITTFCPDGFSRQTTPEDGADAMAVLPLLPCRTLCVEPWPAAGGSVAAEDVSSLKPPKAVESPVAKGLAAESPAAEGPEPEPTPFPAERRLGTKELPEGPEGEPSPELDPLVDQRLDAPRDKNLDLPLSICDVTAFPTLRAFRRPGLCRFECSAEACVVPPLTSPQKKVRFGPTEEIPLPEHEDGVKFAAPMGAALGGALAAAALAKPAAAAAPAAMPAGLVDRSRWSSYEEEEEAEAEKDEEEYEQGLALLARVQRQPSMWSRAASCPLPSKAGEEERDISPISVPSSATAVLRRAQSLPLAPPPAQRGAMESLLAELTPRTPARDSAAGRPRGLDALAAAVEGHHEENDEEDEEVTLFAACASSSSLRAVLTANSAVVPEAADAPSEPESELVAAGTLDRKFGLAGHVPHRGRIQHSDVGTTSCSALQAVTNDEAHSGSKAFAGGAVSGKFAGHHAGGRVSESTDLCKGREDDMALKTSLRFPSSGVEAGGGCAHRRPPFPPENPNWRPAEEYEQILDELAAAMQSVGANFDAAKKRYNDLVNFLAGLSQQEFDDLHHASLQRWPRERRDRLRSWCNACGLALGSDDSGARDVPAEVYAPPWSWRSGLQSVRDISTSLVSRKCA